MTQRSAVWPMFNRIAHRYDLLNRLLSGRQDVVWRKKLLSFFPESKQTRLLDVATGTGDVLLAALNQGSAQHAIGLDMAEQMLKYAQQKIDQQKWQNQASVVVGNAEDLPFENSSFDVVTIAFGIRNVPDYAKAIREMHRVLKPGGRLLILEFSLPANRILRSLYLFYFRHVLPWIGGLISGDRQAYSYLNQSVEAFPYGERFSSLIEQIGFSSVRVTPLTFGIASIYCADK